MPKRVSFHLIVSLTLSLALPGCTTTTLELDALKLNFNQDNASKTAALYNQFIHEETPDIAQLNLFFTQMPKGGDIHHHYSGALYAETYLDWVELAKQTINKKTFQIEQRPSADSITVAQLREDTDLYRRLLTYWSSFDYTTHYHEQPPPDVNFFNTFGYFDRISKFSYPQGLQILKQRAKQENISYIETMLRSVDYSYSDTAFDQSAKNAPDNQIIQTLLEELSGQMDRDENLHKDVTKFVDLVEEVHDNIDDAEFTMRYQTYAYRNSPPSAVFAALYAGFKAAQQSELIVGVNILGPENHPIAIADYNLHMQMFHYLKAKFPNVNKALHAGELKLGLVPPEDLTFHIEAAVNIAGAQRLGHATDIVHASNPMKLLHQMKQDNVVVEICLTSSESILGIKDQAQPYSVYSAYDIPIVIATDDPGVSRNNLSNEYVLLATRYQPSYATIKQYVYNSIQYAFLQQQHKTKLLQSLDQRFVEFEQMMAKYAELIH